VMEASSRVLGEEHPDTLSAMANLAATYRNQGRSKDAEELEVKVMEARSRVLGEEHPHTLTAMANLAHTLKGLCHDDLAINLMRQSATASSKVLGDKHHSSLNRHKHLAAWSVVTSSEEESSDRVSNQTVHRDERESVDLGGKET
jgi:hypothetical protein